MPWVFLWFLRRRSPPQDSARSRRWGGACSFDEREVGGGRCGGVGGLFRGKQAGGSGAMADEVLDGFVASGANVVVGCDTSCMLHLAGRAERRKLDLQFRHLAVVLDEQASS